MFQDIMNNLNKLTQGKTLSDAELSAELEKQAQQKGLNWKTSVVDLLTLLGVDSSLAARDALADELGLPKEMKSGSAEKNEALRMAILKKLSQKGVHYEESSRQI